MEVAFLPAFSDQALSPQDVRALETFVSRSLTTSFVPSNAALPPTLQGVQLKALNASAPAICTLLNVGEASGDPASVTASLLGPDDQFAFAVSREFLLSTFDTLIGQTIDRSGLRRLDFTVEIVVRFLFIVVRRIRAPYIVSLDRVTVDLQDASVSPPSPPRILLTLDGSARTPSELPSFTFRVTQAFTLVLAGGEVELRALGDIDVQVTTGGLPGDVVNQFRSVATNTLRRLRDDIVNALQPDVRRMLSAEVNLKGLLTSLMNPIGAHPKDVTPDTIVPELAYTSLDLGRSGVVLHGALAVPDWPPVHVEFDRIPAVQSHATRVPGSPVRPADEQAPLVTARRAAHDYMAGASWIPGGVIDTFTWSTHTEPQVLRVDGDRFVFTNPPDLPPQTPSAAILGLVPLCLTVTGRRPTAAGPMVEENVSGTICGWSAHPLDPLGALGERLGDVLPDLPLTRPGRDGALEITGHVAPWARRRAGDSSNSDLLVHVADERSIGQLEALTAALAQTGREDAAAGVFVVVPPGLLPVTRSADGIIYADDRNGAWTRLLGVDRPPATLLLRPGGDVAWRRDGDLVVPELVDALRTHLTRGGYVAPRLLRLTVRAGERAPDFLFEHAAGHDLTLRKLAGRSATLVFWKSASAPSLEALRALVTSATAGESIVLAINDGEPEEVARRALDEAGVSQAIPVFDEARRISGAYGVSIWPTTVQVDARGIVRGVQFGTVATTYTEPRVEPQPGAAQQAGPGGAGTRTRA